MFFWNPLVFSMIQHMLTIWSLVPLLFLKPAWTSGSSQFTYCWSLACRILSIPLLACVMSANLWSLAWYFCFLFYISLFRYFKKLRSFGCTGSLLLCVGFLWLWQAGFSLWWPLVAERGLWVMRASVVVVHGLSCSAASGIFLNQGLNLCPLHRQADSQPLDHQRSPR